MREPGWSRRRWATTAAALVIGLAGGWLLHRMPSPATTPGPRSPTPSAVSKTAGEQLQGSFSGVVVKAGISWAVVKVGSLGRELVRINGVNWGHQRGSGVSVPPPAGTRVCALVWFTAPSLRTRVFDEAKVFAGYACTAAPTDRTNGPIF